MSRGGAFRAAVQHGSENHAAIIIATIVIIVITSTSLRRGRSRSRRRLRGLRKCSCACEPTFFIGASADAAATMQ